jgi:hypothetical protein
MPCVEGGLATADLLPGKDDLVSGFAQQRLGIRYGCREDEIAEAGGEELNRHPSTLKLCFRRSVQHVGEGTDSFAAPRGEATWLELQCSVRESWAGRWRATCCEPGMR